MNIHRDILNDCIKLSEELSNKEKNYIINICNKLDFSNECMQYLDNRNLFNKEKLNRCIPSIASDVVSGAISKEDAESIMLLNCILHYGLKHKNLNTKYTYKIIYLNKAIDSIKNKE